MPLLLLSGNAWGGPETVLTSRTPWKGAGDSRSLWSGLKGHECGKHPQLPPVTAQE